VGLVEPRRVESYAPHEARHLPRTLGAADMVKPARMAPPLCAVLAWWGVASTASAAWWILFGPVTATVCGMAAPLRSTRSVKSADPDPQQNRALRRCSPNMPSGEVSKGVVGARSAVARKLLIGLDLAVDGCFARLRGHWAIDQAQAALMKDGTLAALVRQWLGTGATMPS
jgi:hypothetical protein